MGGEQAKNGCTDEKLAGNYAVAIKFLIEALLICPHTILSQQSIRSAFERFLEDKRNLSSHIASQGLLDTGIYRGNILPRIWEMLCQMSIIILSLHTFQYFICDSIYFISF